MTRAQAEYRRVRYADAIAARNARLAEQQVRDAAPDLLAALSELLYVYRAQWGDNAVTRQAHNAIAKATGKV